METEHDYNICPESENGRHEPRAALVSDRDMPAGYFTVECARCGQTTGYRMPDPQEIEW
jgi:hypothetical protein